MNRDSKQFQSDDASIICECIDYGSCFLLSVLYLHHKLAPVLRGCVSSIMQLPPLKSSEISLTSHSKGNRSKHFDTSTNKPYVLFPAIGFIYHK